MHELIDTMLTDLALFVRVADAGGFSAAAKVTKIPQATVSRRIALLEERLETRLFNRTTRLVVMTKAGQRVYEHAKLMLEQGEAASAALSEMQAAPSGTLCITSTVVLGQHFLSDITARFMALYPDVSVHMELTGRRVDLVEEGFDIALRVGSLPDSNLAMHAITILTNGLYASEDYLNRRSAISEPNDLKEHAILAFARSLDPIAIEMSKGHIHQSLTLTPRLAVNEAEPLLAAARSSLGIAFIPSFIGEEEIAAGRLLELLPGWQTPSVELNALTPSFKGEVPAVKEYLAVAKEALAHR